MAVKEYKSTDKTQFTEHFNVKEFRCKCGKSHNILLDTSLVNMLEKLYQKLNCSKIVVNSGYRCASHDKTVGGNGRGQHVLGKAADVVCYDKNGKIIDARIVCCVAQDLNFKGIANISLKYQATHLDVRTNGTYKGNEVVSTNTVTSDFYSYFGITKVQVNKYTGKLDVLETSGYKKGDNTIGSLSLKKLLNIAKIMGLGKYSVSDGNKVDDGTINAINYILGTWGYKQNGIAGSKFINRLYEKITARW